MKEGHLLNLTTKKIITEIKGNHSIVSPIDIIVNLNEDTF